MKKQYVVIATSTRPWTLAAGWLVGTSPTCTKLRDARMIVYFDRPSKGLHGVAAHGPRGDSRVSPPALGVSTYYPVEMILPASEECRKLVEVEPWA